MTCPVCHAETAPGARVCFNCETVFPGDRDSVVELVRESAERDQLLRAARTSSKHGPDSLADDYAALEYANWERHHLPWEHPALTMGPRQWVTHSLTWHWGYLKFLLVLVAIGAAASLVLRATS